MIMNQPVQGISALGKSHLCLIRELSDLRPLGSQPALKQCLDYERVKEL